MRKSNLYLAMVASAFLLTACVHTPSYEVCDTPNCGDDVTIEVE